MDFFFKCFSLHQGLRQLLPCMSSVSKRHHVLGAVRDGRALSLTKAFFLYYYKLSVPGNRNRRSLKMKLKSDKYSVMCCKQSRTVLVSLSNWCFLFLPGSNHGCAGTEDRITSFKSVIVLSSLSLKSVTQWLFSALLL